jgi:hypothetical protein
MVRIDTQSLRRALLVLAPVAGLLGVACGGSADGSGGGDMIDDPANVAHVDGYEGQDEGWAAALDEANVPAPATPPVADEASEGSSDIGKSQDALTVTSRGYTLVSEHRRQLSYLKVSTSYYDHTTYMNEETGTRRTDCSGWVDYSLIRVLRSAYDLVPHPNTYKPLADDWYRYLSARPSSESTDTSKARWRRILHAQDLKRGDLVVWLTADGSSSDNTGHVMMVDGTPTRGRTSEWLVPVMDSTTAPHANDTRGTTHTGPGKGTIGLKVDSYGKPVAYYWRGGLSYNAIATPIVLGRLE